MVKLFNVLMTISILELQFQVVFVGKCIAIRSQKANKTLVLPVFTLSPCSKEVQSRSYQTLVHPQHEYAAETWNPYNISIADRLEHIQHAADSFIHHIDAQHP